MRSFDPFTGGLTLFSFYHNFFLLATITQPASQTFGSKLEGLIPWRELWGRTLPAGNELVVNGDLPFPCAALPRSFA